MNKFTPEYIADLIERGDRMRVMRGLAQTLCGELADALAELEADNLVLATGKAELEEKAIFAERWITQTCETGQIAAVRNQYIAGGPEWILSVAIPPEADDE